MDLGFTVGAYPFRNHPGSEKGRHGVTFARIKVAARVFVPVDTRGSTSLSLSEISSLEALLAIGDTMLWRTCRSIITSYGYSELSGCSTFPLRIAYPPSALTCPRGRPKMRARAAVLLPMIGEGD